MASAEIALPAPLRGSLVVWQDDRPIRESYEGPTDPRPGEAIGNATRFQIASVSKGFTATAILLLAQEGRQAVSDPINRWIDQCPPHWQPITIQHILTHTSGLGTWRDYPEIDLSQQGRADRVDRGFRSRPLLFAPGRQWRYSSPGYVLLAHIVERASDQPYRSFLQTRIFEPLELRDTFAGSAINRGSIAAGYVNGEPVASLELDVVAMGAGDIWCTARDLGRWPGSLDADRLLTPPWRQLMFANHAKIDPADSGNLVPDACYG